eukprot:CCRYP_013108-RA/>CCRYP_013108-RA protein AED:0.49 eAED:0.50 QI:0/0/0/0.5/1/1/2/0/124
MCLAHDAGKNLRFYISNFLKKPNKVQVHHSVQHMVPLNNYVEDLPCLYYSPSWQDQYHLLEKCYTEGVKPLLLILEGMVVTHPVDEKQSTARPAKAQATKQPSRKFAPAHMHSQEAQAGVPRVH